MQRGSGCLLLGRDEEAAVEQGPGRPARGGLLFFSRIRRLQEHEFLLGFFGFVEDGFELFTGVAAGFVGCEGGGDDAAQVTFPALKV